MTKQKKHGGKRLDAGRKPGKKAFKKAKPNPTTIRRIPDPILERVDEYINEYYLSIAYKKLKKKKPK